VTATATLFLSISKKRILTFFGVVKTAHRLTRPVRYMTKTENHTLASLTQRLGLPRTSVQRLLETEKLPIRGRSAGGRVLELATNDLESLRADYAHNLCERLVKLSTNPQDHADARLIDAWQNANTAEERAGLWPEFGKRLQENVFFRGLLDKSNAIKGRAYSEKQAKAHAEIKAGTRSGNRMGEI